MTPRSLQGLGRLVGLGALSALFLLPFAYMLAFSVKSPSEIFGGSLSLLPATLDGFANYPNALARSPLLRHLWNGLIVCAGILAFQLVFPTPCPYGLAKLRFRGREVVFGLVLFGLYSLFKIALQVPLP